MNTFKKILEIKTAKKNLFFKAIYIKHKSEKLKWTFYIYYYHKESHCFYINWINKKTISEKNLNEIINRTFKKEEKRDKKPSFFYFSLDDETVYIHRIKLKAFVNSTWDIVELFIDPTDNFNSHS